MNVTVEDGKAVAIGGDPDHPFTRGFLCAKVNPYLERVYSPERLLHPLQRPSERNPKESPGSRLAPTCNLGEAQDALRSAQRQLAVYDFDVDAQHSAARALHDATSLG